MEDTTHEIEQAIYHNLMSRTEEERFLMCADLFETAKEFAVSQVPPGLSELEQKRFVFKKIYGQDWPEKR